MPDPKSLYRQGHGGQRLEVKQVFNFCVVQAGLWSLRTGLFWKLKVFTVESKKGSYLKTIHSVV